MPPVCSLRTILRDCLLTLGVTRCLLLLLHGPGAPECHRIRCSGFDFLRDLTPGPCGFWPAPVGVPPHVTVHVDCCYSLQGCWRRVGCVTGKFRARKRPGTNFVCAGSGLDSVAWLGVDLLTLDLCRLIATR